MENEFIDLTEALFGLYRHELMRTFYFRFLNSQYESAMYPLSLASEPYSETRLKDQTFTLEQKADYVLLEAKDL